MRIYVNGTMVEVTGKQGPAGPDGNPIGTVISFMGSAAPEDYLVCDGGVHNIAEYPDLAEFFREQFGSASHFGGDGETTFAVPTVQGTETGMLSCIKARKSAAAEDVYSLEERIVGRWIDGRPVYQKTLILNRITVNSTSLSSVAIPTALIPADMDNILRYNGHFVRRSDNLKAMMPSHYLSVSCDKNRWILLYSNFSGTIDGYLTIRYTKTTDQPTIPLPEAAANVPQEDWPGAAEDETVREEV